MKKLKIYQKDFLAIKALGGGEAARK